MSKKKRSYTAVFKQNVVKLSEEKEEKAELLKYWDNAVAESFFKSLKTEWIYKNHYDVYSDAEISIFKWIETGYNWNRRHLVLNYKTINELELEINNQNLEA